MSTPVSSPASFQLRDHQREWADRAFDILKRHYYYIDTSQLRSGKSYVALWIAKQANLPVFIVAPRSSHGSWKKALKLVRVYHVALMSYQSFAGTIEGVNHPYLSTHTVTVKGAKELVYNPSSKFKALVKEGVLIIFDEMHNLKNDTGNSRAAAALIQAIVESDSPATRCALLSATPFDQVEHATVLLRTLGVISTCHLLDNILGTITYVGLKEALDYFNYLDSAKTEAICALHPIASHADAHRLVLQLYTDILMPEICGSMALDSDVQKRMDFTNTFFYISPEHQDAVATALAKLNRVVEDIEHGRSIRKKGSPGLPGTQAMQAINEAMYDLERAKLPDMERMTRSILDWLPNTKVVLALQGLESMQIMTDNLQDYGSRLIQGQVDPDERTQLAHEFNTDPAVRVMIVNLNLCEGFSLYPENIAEDRILLISPSFRFISIIQTTGRICGTDMIGKAYIKMFYADVGDENVRGEKANVDRIYNLTRDKSNIMEQTLDQYARSALILPNNYRDESEGDLYNTIFQGVDFTQGYEETPTEVVETEVVETTEDTPPEDTPQAAEIIEDVDETQISEPYETQVTQV